MSTKYVVAAAALATVAITQAEATKFSIDKAKRIAPLPSQLDEQQAGWNFNAGIQGGAGGRPQWSASIGAKWEEEEQRFGRGGIPSSTGPFNPNSSRGFDEEQRFGRGGIPSSTGPFNPNSSRGFDEEQFGRGAQWPGQVDGTPKYRPEYGATFDEEQFGRGSYPSSTGPFNPNSSRGWDEEQKLRLNKVVKGIKKVNNVVNKAQQVGLLDEEQFKTPFPNGVRFPTTPPYNPSPSSGTLDEEQADWNFNAGIQGGAGGKPQWSASIGAKWEEEQHGFGRGWQWPGQVDGTPKYRPEYGATFDGEEKNIDVLKRKFHNAVQKIQDGVSDAVRKFSLRKSESRVSLADETSAPERPWYLNCMRRSRTAVGQLKQAVESAKKSQVLDEEEAQLLAVSIKKLEAQVEAGFASLGE